MDATGETVYDCTAGGTILEKDVYKRQADNRMELIERYFPDLTSEQRRQFALLGSLYAT